MEDIGLKKAIRLTWISKEWYVLGEACRTHRGEGKCMQHFGRRN
jgi:hypothetical protein